jgi:iron complex transport system substrate-binding protein
VRLAPREHIASITWLGKDPRHSTIAAVARDIPANRGTAEEAVRLEPDLVLANAHAARLAADFLKRRNTSVLDPGSPKSLPEVRAQIRRVAAAVGEPGRGEALIAGMDARIANATPGTTSRPSAIMLGPNGFATAYSPLLDEAFARAGLDNLAARLGGSGLAAIPIEKVVRSGVDILVVEETEDSPALAGELMRHPALAILRQRATIVEVPSRLWTCAGPQLADAVEILARARAAHERAR